MDFHKTARALRALAVYSKEAPVHFSKEISSRTDKCALFSIIFRAVQLIYYSCPVLQKQYIETDKNKENIHY